MNHPARTITSLLSTLERRQALCAFNIETFPMLRAAFRAAADIGSPVVIAYSQPAAQALGFRATAELVSLVADWYPDAQYALHLDHCQDPRALIAAVAQGFTSANFLDDGEVPAGTYMDSARELRAELAGKASLEFIAGRLGHIDDPDIEVVEPRLEEIVAFAQACQPEILGFDSGSIHGMRNRTQTLDHALIGAVAEATGLPQVLHGSSGVQTSEILAAIDAGIRKVNIETALRGTYIDTIRDAITGGTATARKPRLLERQLEDTMTDTFTTLLLEYTQRKG